jgi:hypothetical protein
MGDAVSIRVSEVSISGELTTDLVTLREGTLKTNTPIMKTASHKDLF